MLFTTKSTGGFTNGYERDVESLDGAFRYSILAITTAISALDYLLKVRRRKLRKRQIVSNEVFGEEATKLMVLKRVLDDSNLSLEDKRELVKLANKDIEGLNAQSR